MGEILRWLCILSAVKADFFSIIGNSEKSAVQRRKGITSKITQKKVLTTNKKTQKKTLIKGKETQKIVLIKRQETQKKVLTLIIYIES